MGVIITDGKVVRGRLEIGRRKIDLPSLVLEAEALKGAVSGPVRVALSDGPDKSIFAIAKADSRLRPRWILCYIPAPELLRQIEPRVRDALLDAMVAERVISPDFANEVRGNRT